MPRRILLLITDLEIGGTPTVVRELAMRLHRPPEVIVEVACLKPAGPVEADIRAAGVEVTSLGAQGAADLPRTLWRLVRLIRRGPDYQPPLEPLANTLPYHARRLPFDTVFSFLIHANALAAFARPFCRGARFIQSIQTTQPYPEWHWWLQDLIGFATRDVVVPSESVAKTAVWWASGVRRSKIRIIPNGVDPDAFPRAATPSDDPQPYPAVFIGRLDPIKRVPDLLHAIKLLDGLVRLDIYGGGSELRTLESLADELAINPLVKFHGPVAHPSGPLAQAGLLVLPSDAEGFGLVLIEAMAAGVPVLATNAPGIRDVVKNEVTGLLAPPRAPAALAAAIRRIVEDRALRLRLVKAGLAEVRLRYDWAMVIQHYRILLRL